MDKEVAKPILMVSHANRIVSHANRIVPIFPGSPICHFIPSNQYSQFSSVCLVNGLSA